MEHPPVLMWSLNLGSLRTARDQRESLLASYLGRGIFGCFARATRWSALPSAACADGGQHTSPLEPLSSHGSRRSHRSGCEFLHHRHAANLVCSRAACQTALPSSAHLRHLMTPFARM